MDWILKFILGNYRLKFDTEWFEGGLFVLLVFKIVKILV